LRGRRHSRDVPLSRAPAWTTCATLGFRHSCEKKGEFAWSWSIVRSPVLGRRPPDEVKSRSAADAAAKLAGFQRAGDRRRADAPEPGFAQDVLGALPDEARERALAAAPPEVSRQWQRNALLRADAIGRMMSQY